MASNRDRDRARSVEVRRADVRTVFPHPTGSFVGRRAEIERMLRLLDDEYLFFVYGIAGIGKSELVYKVIQEARQLDRWKSAEPVLVAAEPDRGVEHFVARLRARLGLPVSGSAPAQPLDEHLRDELLDIAAAMETRPVLLFVDDAHYLENRTVSMVLGYLARNIHISRIFAASRSRLDGEGDFGAPVVVQLDPLDATATNQMIEALADRLDVAISDRSAIALRARGSPFLVQRELTRLSLGYDARDDVLRRTLEDLPAACHDLLVLAAAFRGRLPMACARTRLDAPALRDCVERLARRFLVNVEADLFVAHDIVCAAVSDAVGHAELCESHRVASAFFLDAFVTDPDRNPIELVAAVRHLVAAGDCEEAWDLVEEWDRPIAASGIDHLLVDDLAAMANALPERRFSIELLRARILARRSIVDGACAVLERLSRDPLADRSFAFLLLAGEVEQRTGDLEKAEELFGRARDAASTAGERFHAALQLAAVAAVRGHCEEARRIGSAALAELEWPSARHRGRSGWIEAISYSLEQRFESAIAAIDGAISGLKGQRQDDLAARLSLLKAVALAECDRIGDARATVARLRKSSVGSLALREDISSLCHAVVGMARGDMRGAAVSLRRAVEGLSSHEDRLYACIGAFYLGEAWLALGELGRAGEIVSETLESALDAGLDALVPHGMALHAKVLLRAGSIEEARERAQEALAQPRAPVRARVMARCALAESHALTGDFQNARRFLIEEDELLQGGAGAALRARVATCAAEVAVMSGDCDAGIAHAENAWRHFAARGRRYEEAWAASVLAAAYSTRGGRADLVLADKLLARGRELVTAGGYQLLALRLCLVEARIEERRHAGSDLSRDVAEDALREAPPGADSIEMRAVRAFLQGSSAASAVPEGVAKAVPRVDRERRAEWLLSDRNGTRPVEEAQVKAAEATRELVVHLTRGIVIGARGQHRVKNRPVMCRLLAEFVNRQGEPLSAEHLYQRVWDGREFHPLRHRGTVYVAVNRLRKTLTTFFPQRQLIETVPDGWRLADEIDACVVRKPERES